MTPRRLFLAQILLLVASCTRLKSPQINLKKLIVGVIAYGEGVQSVEQYQSFINYLETQTKTLIELEPAYNEVQAIKQIQRQAWSLVFAPPGLAAIAISKANYISLFPLQGRTSRRSLIVVLATSNIHNLTNLNGKIIALGQPGSATSYYVPLYTLYGTTPAEVRISPTPKTTLDWLAKKEVAAGALSEDEFERYKTEFDLNIFKILTTSLRVPSGSVLISPNVEPNQRQFIQQVMSAALPEMVQQAGYVPEVRPPEYKTLINFIEKVKPIEARINQKPAPLY